MGFKVKNMTAQKYEEIPKFVLLVELPECIQVLWKTTPKMHLNT